MEDIYCDIPCYRCDLLSIYACLPIECVTIYAYKSASEKRKKESALYIAFNRQAGINAICTLRVLRPVHVRLFDCMLLLGRAHFLFLSILFFQRENLLFFLFFHSLSSTYVSISKFQVECGAFIRLRLMVEQASNKTKNTSYSARQGVSQGQKPYTQTTFFSLRKFPFPRSTVSRTV